MIINSAFLVLYVLKIGIKHFKTYNFEIVMLRNQILIRIIEYDFNKFVSGVA